jgi:hypothetical protein
MMTTVNGSATPAPVALACRDALPVPLPRAGGRPAEAGAERLRLG